MFGSIFIASDVIIILTFFKSSSFLGGKMAIKHKKQKSFKLRMNESGSSKKKFSPTTTSYGLWYDIPCNFELKEDEMPPEHSVQFILYNLYLKSENDATLTKV